MYNQQVQSVEITDTQLVNVSIIYFTNLSKYLMTCHQLLFSYFYIILKWSFGFAIIGDMVTVMYYYTWVCSRMIFPDLTFSRALVPSTTHCLCSLTAVTCSSINVLLYCVPLQVYIGNMHHEYFRKHLSECYSRGCREGILRWNVVRTSFTRSSVIVTLSYVVSYIIM